MNKTYDMYMPVGGKIIPLKDVNHYITEEIVSGMGIGIMPESDIFYSPISGDVVVVGENLNYVGISVNGDFTVVLQCGIHTEELKGRGFSSYVREGDKVTAGDKLLFMDRDYVNNKAEATSVLMLTNFSKIDKVEINHDIEEPFQKVMSITLK